MSLKHQHHHPLVSDKDVIDWDMNKLDEKSNKAHDQKSNTGCPCNGSEFFTVGFGTFFDKVNGVLGKLTKRLDENLVESLLLSHVDPVCCVFLFATTVEKRRK